MSAKGVAVVTEIDWDGQGLGGGVGDVFVPVSLKGQHTEPHRITT